MSVAEQVVEAGFRRLAPLRLAEPASAAAPASEHS